MEKSAVVVAAAFPVVILEADLPLLLPLLLPRPLPLPLRSPLFLLLLFSCHPSPQAEDLLLPFAFAFALAFALALAFAFVFALTYPHSSHPKRLF